MDYLHAQLSLLQASLELVKLLISLQTPIVEAKTLPPIFSAVAFCESGGKQFTSDGSVVTSKTFDYGKYQINRIHLPEAISQGIDIMTEEGNTEFATILYQRNGLKDWSASRSCWSKSLPTTK